MSSSTLVRSLSVVSSAMTSRASMIGIPASTKTPELAREVHDLLALHRLASDLELQDALVLTTDSGWSPR